MHLWKESVFAFYISSCQVTADSSSLLKLPLLQAEQIYFLQPLLVQYVLQVPDHPLTSPLNLLWLVPAFLVL